MNAASGTSAGRLMHHGWLGAAGRVIGLLLAGWLAMAGPASAEFPPGQARIVRSMAEIRHDKVVIQKWDLSCGTAALATMLNFQHGDPVGEREIAIALMGRAEYLADPNLVRARFGFSLLDLKRYVDQRGYRGTGFGQLAFDDLIAKAPILVPVNFLGYNHFVIFRGALRDRVLLADPAYGNRTVTREEFMAAWIDYPELGRIGFVIERRDGLIPPDRLMASPEDFMTFN